MTIITYRLDPVTFARLRPRLTGYIFYRETAGAFLVRFAMPNAQLRKQINHYKINGDTPHPGAQDVHRR